jgi:hypothetical protein
MGIEVTKYKITFSFEVELERDENEEQESLFQASVTGLEGCQVHASSKARVLRKIRKAIDIWLTLANRQFADDVLSIEERIDSLLPD